jgi:hypothetical protein
MNFLKTLPEMIHQNANMDEEQLQISANFVDELVSLGVLRLPKDVRDIVLNAPLFVVPKPGQLGQWQCIADMLRGGQNQCVRSDPVYLPCAEHILDQMYTDGWSAVLDLSKYFHNFPTHPDDPCCCAVSCASLSNSFYQGQVGPPFRAPPPEFLAHATSREDAPVASSTA